MGYKFDKILIWKSAKVSLVAVFGSVFLTLLALYIFVDDTWAFVGVPISYQVYISIGAGVSIAAGVSLVVGFFISCIVFTQSKQLELANIKLGNLIRFDQLTGLLSRRTFFSEVTLALKEQSLVERSGAVFFMDLDYFKQINDQHGHAAGDSVLRKFGEVIVDQLQDGEFAGRLGGEEFAMFIPGCSLDLAKWRAERVAENFSRQTVIAGDIDICCTVSIGVCVEETIKSLDAMLSHADKLLYKAKQNGRNRVYTSVSLKIAA